VVGLLTRPRLAYGLTVCLLVPLGIGSKLYRGPGSTFIVGYSGGFIYVWLWIFVVLAVRPGLSISRVTVGVFVATCMVEVLQLVRGVPWLDAFRSTFVGHGLLGSTFSWGDFVCYALAAGVAPFMVRAVERAVERASGSVAAE